MTGHISEEEPIVTDGGNGMPESAGRNDEEGL